ncbi:MAG: NAD-dependent epimerase/dehydratase family protein [Chloroflexi bacterium]|nr:NAD-dependent epimerase/dehydratase family protein [Chloroflexota bacterium]
MVKALITGATGCVGANLVEAVTQHGWEARALRRTTSSLKALEGLAYQPVIGDVTDVDSLTAAMQEVDVVFHAAAVADYWRTGQERLYTINVEGTRNVLRAAQACHVRKVVYTSSVASLGQPPFGTTVDESAQFNLRPEQFHYGYSKVLAERVVRAFVADGLDVVIVNPAVVIGPRDVNLISGSIILAMSRIGIPVYPSGGVCVIDVADVCAAHIAAAECGRAGERYILGGENLWYRDMMAVTAQVVGRKPPRIALAHGVMHILAGVVDFLQHRLKMTLPANGDQLRFATETFWFDSGKARRELGLSTRPYAEAARRTFEWYRAHGYI